MKIFPWCVEVFERNQESLAFEAKSFCHCEAAEKNPWLALGEEGICFASSLKHQQLFIASYPDQSQVINNHFLLLIHYPSFELSLKDMRRSSFCFLLALQILSWVSATTRILAPDDARFPHQSGLIQNSLHAALKSKKGVDRRKEEGEVKQEEAYYYGGRGKIGSSRPSCEHKCYGCNPCEAIQMPTVTGESRHVSVQYTNYEPEGWKCKCGPSFYTP